MRNKDLFCAFKRNNLNTLGPLFLFEIGASERHGSVVSTVVMVTVAAEAFDERDNDAAEQKRAADGVEPPGLIPFFRITRVLARSRRFLLRARRLARSRLLRRGRSIRLACLLSRRGILLGGIGLFPG